MNQLNQFDRKHYYFARSLKEAGLSDLSGQDDKGDFWVAILTGFLLFFI